MNLFSNFCSFVFLYFQFWSSSFLYFLTACQLIKKERLCHSHDNGLILLKLVRQKHSWMDFFTKIKSGSHVCISKILKVSSCRQLERIAYCMNESKLLELNISSNIQNILPINYAVNDISSCITYVSDYSAVYSIWDQGLGSEGKQVQAYNIHKCHQHIYVIK